MKLIALTGLPRSGKDTFANYLTRYYYVRRAFATPLKQAAAVLLGREVWEMEGERGFDREAVLPEWGFTTRHFLQYLGTEAIRNYQSDFWIRRMRSELEKLHKVIITDCRFPNEVDLVHAYGGKVVNIVRDGCVDNGHISNKPVPYDIQIENNGTLEEFETAIRQCVEKHRWQ